MMWVFAAFLAAHVAKFSDSGEVMSGPPAIQVFVRSLLLRPGLTEEQTISLLGLQNTRVLYMTWSVSGSTWIYPLRPNYQILLRYHLDDSSRSIRHILSGVSIGKAGDG
jgi:hypothetical protein